MQVDFYQRTKAVYVYLKAQWKSYISSIEWI